MPYTVFSLGIAPELLDFAERSLAENIDALLTTWQEKGRGPRAYAIVDHNGMTQATILRDPVEPELAHVLRFDGTAHTYRCKMIDQAGTDQRTLSIELVGRPVNPRRVKCEL
jgi:hypothetical protein